MFFQGISPGSIILILFVLLLLYGSNKISKIGEDLGKAVRNFRKGLEGEDNDRNKLE